MADDSIMDLIEEDRKAHVLGLRSRLQKAEDEIRQGQQDFSEMVEALKMTTATGMPYRKSLADLQIFSPKELWKKPYIEAVPEIAPTLTKRVVEKNQGPVFAPDFPTMVEAESATRELVNNLMVGGKMGPLMDTKGVLAYRDMMGWLTEDDRHQMAAINWKLAQLEQESSEDMPDWFVRTGASAMTQVAAQMAKIDKRRLAAMTGYGIAVGTALGVPGGPLAGVTAPMGGAAGASAAFAAHSLEHNYMVIAGYAWEEINKIKDKDGNPVDPDRARKLAQVIGTIGAAPETFVQVFSVLGMHKAVSGAAVRKFIAKLVRSPKLTDYFLKFATNRIVNKIATNRVVTGTASEGLQEGFESLTKDVTIAIDLEYFEEDFDQVKSLGKIWTDAVEEAKAGAVGGFFFGSTGEVVSTGADKINRMREQSKRLKTSKLFNEDPSAIADLLNEAVDDEDQTEASEVWVDAEELKALFQADGRDDRWIEANVPSIGKQLAEAEVAGTQVGIKAGEFMAHIAASENFDQLKTRVMAKPHDNQLVSDMEVDIEQQQAAVADSERSAIEAIQADIQQRFIAGGAQPARAEALGSLFAGFFEARAAESKGKISAAELAERYRVSVEHNITPLENPERMEMLVDMLQRGEIVTEKDIAGPTLAEFLKGKEDMTTEAQLKMAQKLRYVGEMDVAEFLKTKEAAGVITSPMLRKASKARLATELAHLQRMAEDLKANGIDLYRGSPAEVVNALRQVAVDPDKRKRYTETPPRSAGLKNVEGAFDSGESPGATKTGTGSGGVLFQPVAIESVQETDDTHRMATGVVSRGFGQGKPTIIKYYKRDFSKFGTRKHDAGAWQAHIDLVNEVPVADRNAAFEMRQEKDPRRKLFTVPIYTLSRGCFRNPAVLSATEAGYIPEDIRGDLNSCHGACYKNMDQGAQTGGNIWNNMLIAARKEKTKGKPLNKKLAGWIANQMGMKIPQNVFAKQDGKDHPTWTKMRQRYNKLPVDSKRAIWEALREDYPEYYSEWVPQEAQGVRVATPEYIHDKVWGMTKAGFMKWVTGGGAFLRGNQQGDWLNELVADEQGRTPWETFAEAVLSRWEKETGQPRKQFPKYFSVITGGWYADVPFDTLTRIADKYGDHILVQVTGPIDFKGAEADFRLDGYIKLHDAGLTPIMRLVTDEYGVGGSHLNDPESIRKTIEFITANKLLPKQILETPIHYDHPSLANPRLSKAAQAKMAELVAQGIDRDEAVRQAYGKNIKKVAIGVQELFDIPMDEAEILAIKVLIRNTQYEQTGPDPKTGEEIKIGPADIGLTHERLRKLGIPEEQLEELKRLGFSYKWRRTKGEKVEGVFPHRCCTTGKCATCKDQCNAEYLTAIDKAEEKKATDIINTLSPTEAAALLKDGLTYNERLKLYNPRNRALFQSMMKAPIWRTVMPDVLEAKLPAAGSPQGYVDAIKAYMRKGMIKAEEVEASGLIEALEQWEGKKVLKEDVMSYLAANEMRLEEVVRSEHPTAHIETARERFEREWESEDEWVRNYWYEGIEEEAHTAWEDPNHRVWANLAHYGKQSYIQDEIDADPDLDEEDAAKIAFDQFTEDVHGLDIVEIFEPEEIAEAKDNAWTDFGARYEEEYMQAVDYEDYPAAAMETERAKYPDPNWRTAGLQEDYREIQLIVPIKYLPEKMAPFTSGHWDEQNVVVWVRLTVRTDPQGKKILYIEEIQSDWHQQGRKHGYVSPDQQNPKILKLKEELQQAKLKRDKIIKRAREKWYATAETENIERERAERLIRNFSDAEIVQAMGDHEAYNDTIGYIANIQYDLRDAYSQEVGGKKVPDVPWKKSWPLLAMKRMVRYAAENGFDRIAWTPGIEQAQRYDLSRHVDRVAYNPKYEHLMAYEKNSAVAVLSKQNVKPEDLADYIGKEAADKIMQNPTTIDGNLRTLEGQDLQIGGEGMKGFYDVMLPSMVKKYFGKAAWGKPDIGTTEIVTGTGIGEEITPELLAKAAAMADSAGDLKAAQFLGEQVKQLEDTGKYSMSIHNTNMVWEGEQSVPYYLDKVREYGDQTMTVPTIEITDKMRERALTEGMPLFQEQGGFRGYTTMNQLADGFKITLTKKGDLTTYLHESAHVFFGIYTDMAQRGLLNDEAMDRYNAMLSHIGAAAGDPLSVESQEKFVELFEDYMVTGRAPTTTLQRLFREFKNWLITTYQRLRRRLPEDVKIFMDHLFATQQSIAKAGDERGGLIFRDPVDMKRDKKAPVTAADRQRYIDYVWAYQEVEEEAEEHLLASILKDNRGLQHKAFKKAMADARAKAEEELAKDPAQVANHFLRTGKMLDNRPVDEYFANAKLNGAMLRQIFPADADKPLLKKVRHLTRANGMDPDEVAMYLGYDHASDMVRAVARLGNLHQEKQKYVKDQLQKQFSPMTMGQMHDKAYELLEGPAMQRFRQMEEEHLDRLHRAAGKASHATRLTRDKISVMREFAKDQIAKTSHRDLRAYKYRTAESRAIKELTAAIASGDYTAAAVARRKQRLNEFLYREAVQAKEQGEAIRRYARKFVTDPKAQKRMAIGGRHFLETIHAILEYVDLKEITADEAKFRKNLRTYVDRIQNNEMGQEVDLPKWLMEEGGKINWRDLPMERLRGIERAIKHIEHLSRTYGSAKLAEERQDLVTLNLTLATQMETNNLPLPKSLDQNPRSIEAMRNGMRFLMAYLTKVEQICLWIDGGTPGLAHKNIFVPIANAQHDFNDMMLRYRETLTVPLKKYLSDKKNRRRLNKYVMFYRKELDHMGRVQEVPHRLTVEELVAMGLNMFTLSNREKMLGGYGWTEDRVMDLLDRHLLKEDWDMIETILKEINSIWPHIAKVQREVNGIEAPKVGGVLLQTKYGMYGDPTGNWGYYPVRYDPRRSHTADRHEQTDEFMATASNGVIMPVVGHGFMEERSDYTGPVLLDLTMIPRHINETLHFYSHAQAINNVSKLTRMKIFREAMTETFGKEYYDLLNPYLLLVANQGRVDRLADPLAKIPQYLKSANSIYVMGANVWSAMMQTLGLFASAHRIGAKYTMRGVRRLFNPVEFSRMYKFARDNSGEMRHLDMNYDREIREALLQARDHTKLRWVSDWIVQASFYPLQMVQRAVSTVTFQGAYEMLVDQDREISHEDAVSGAESYVRMTQSSGAVKDLAKVQTANPYFQIFNLFYTYMSVAVNILNTDYRDIVRFANKGQLLKAGKRAIGHYWYMMFLPYIVPEMVRRISYGPPEDEEDAKSLTDYLLYEPLLENTRMVPVIGPAIGEKLKGYQPRDNPIEAYQRSIDRLGSVYDAWKEDTLTARDLKNLLDPITLTLKLPGKEIYDWGYYMYLLGEDELKNPYTGWFTRPLPKE